MFKTKRAQPHIVAASCIWFNLDVINSSRRVFFRLQLKQILFEIIFTHSRMFASNIVRDKELFHTSKVFQENININLNYYCVIK